MADQRFAEHRPDVLSYISAPLDHDLTVTGQLLVDLFASTSGTQKFVPSIYQATAADYVTATQRVYCSPGMASHIVLPVVK